MTTVCQCSINIIHKGKHPSADSDVVMWLSEDVFCRRVKSHQHKPESEVRARVRMDCGKTDHRELSPEGFWEVESFPSSVSCDWISIKSISMKYYIWKMIEMFCWSIKGQTVLMFEELKNGSACFHRLFIFCTNVNLMDVMERREPVQLVQLSWNVWLKHKRASDSRASLSVCSSAAAHLGCCSTSLWSTARTHVTARRHSVWLVFIDVFNHLLLIN